MSRTAHDTGIESLDLVTLVVDDVADALAFYTDTLGFETRTDETFEMEGATGRWVTVGLPGQDLSISLVRADEPYYDDDTRALLEAKKGTETWWTFRTDDCEATVDALREAGVEITRDPRTYEWSTEAMFADPAGNEFSVFEYADG